jgi:tRNA threonylcarbamoyladenosine biosynthesis protein TsaB
MRILALDSSARTGSVALQEGLDLLVDAAVEMERKHSERLMNTVDWALNTVGWRGAAVDVVAVSHGPGPFTAIRVGVTLAKTLAYGWGAQLVSFSTMDAIARGYRHHARPIHILFDARKQQVFSARYMPSADGRDLRRQGDIACCSIEDALTEAPPDTLYIGNGAHAYRATILAAGAADHDIADAPADIARAGALAAMAAEALAVPDYAPADTHSLAPTYVRRPEAVARAESAAAR